MSYGPPSLPTNAKPFTDKKSNEEIAVTKASSNDNLVLSFIIIHLI